MNYLNIFAPKYQNSGKLPPTGNSKNDLKLENVKRLYENEGLSTANTPEALIVEGALLKGPFDTILGLVGKLSKTIKTIKTTNKFKNFVGKVGKDKGIDFLKLSETEIDFVRDLLSQGVDISKLSEGDIKMAINNRKAFLQTTAPELRYALITEEPMENSLIRGLNTKIETFSKNSPKSTGYLRLETSPNEYSIEMIQSENLEKGISQQAYNAAIDYAKQLGQPGVVSGKLLFMPEITTSVWKHYPNKKLLGNYGHQIGVGGHTPVYLLMEPSYKVPIKNAVKFNLNTLDKSGNMLIDWNNPNMFYEAGGKF